MKRLNRLSLFALAFALAILLSGALGSCTSQKSAPAASTASGGAVSFQDDLGRSITVQSPRRVAAMIGSFTDIWLLAGGEIAAAAQDSWALPDWTLSPEAVNLGSMLEPNLEQLLAVEPDLVLASANLDSHRRLQETLEAAGIPVAYFGVEDFPDYLRMLEICTRITKNPDAYEQYGLGVEEQIQATLQADDGSHPSVLYLRATSSDVKAKGSDENVGCVMLKNLGCVNIADAARDPAGELSLEQIVAADPDFIFLVIMNGSASEALDQLMSDPAWASLTAVREKRVYPLDKKLFNSKPNAKWGYAYAQLAGILYGYEQ